MPIQPAHSHRLAAFAFSMLAVAAGMLTPGSARGDLVSEIQADNPLIYWRLDEANKAAGQTAANSASGSNSLGTVGNGTYQNSVGNVADTPFPGNAGASFNDTGDRVRFEAAGTFPTSAFTLEFLVRGAAGTPSQPTLLSYEASGGGNRIVFLANDSNVWQAFINNASSVTTVSEATILNGEWQHSL